MKAPDEIEIGVYRTKTIPRTKYTRTALLSDPAYLASVGLMVIPISTCGFMCLGGCSLQIPRDCPSRCESRLAVEPKEEG